MPNNHICSRNSKVELLRCGVGGAELKKLEQSSAKRVLRDAFINFSAVYDCLSFSGFGLPNWCRI